MTKACSIDACNWIFHSPLLHPHENSCGCYCNHCEANENSQMWNARTLARFWHCLFAVADGDDAEVMTGDRDQGLASA